jgi:PIN domain nuclease of toxin-antitoxin system
LSETVLLDTHVVQWWSAEPERLSPGADAVVSGAADLAVAAITWFELAWLSRHGRISLGIPMRSWLGQLSGQLRTLGITAAIADTALGLPDDFPGDPADRLIYATAIEHGLPLITKDARLRRQAGSLAVW